MTGSCAFAAVPAGTNTFRFRQSSLPTVPVGFPFASNAGWMHSAPNFVALRTPDHGTTAAGGRHRNEPTGGAAYGTPRHSSVEPFATPCSLPLAVFTTKPGEGDADETNSRHAHTRNTRTARGTS